MLDKQSTADQAKELGRLLRKARAAKGWTLRQAAAETGISNGYLSLIEQGEVKAPSPRYLLSLAENYSLSFEELMALAGHPSGPLPVAGSAAVSATAEERRPVDRGVRDRAWVGAGLAGTFGATGAAHNQLGSAEVDDAVTGNHRFAEGDALPEEGRQALIQLVLDEMRGFTATDIAQVRAFIAGIRASTSR